MLGKPKSNLYKLNKTITFVGLYGVGKSSIGFKLSQYLDNRFFDSDKEVEILVGCSITDIFKYQGEYYFRKKEKEVISNLLINRQDPIILSTGSGAYIEPDIRDIIKLNTFTIWLKSDIKTLYHRIIRKNTRPNFNDSDDKYGLLQKLEAERSEIYAQSDAIIDCSNLRQHEILESLMALFKQNSLLTKYNL